MHEEFLKVVPATCSYRMIFGPNQIKGDSTIIKIIEIIAINRQFICLEMPSAINHNIKTWSIVIPCQQAEGKTAYN